MNAIELHQELLDIALDAVYDVQDASSGVNPDLEKLIFTMVNAIESMVDQNDKLMAEWK
tara:strand:+ start:436 stop:612 length:177 start_codon:yes stop_codon:yes gene_type:complete